MRRTPGLLPHPQSRRQIPRELTTAPCRQSNRPRPPDRCRILAVEDHCQGRRVAPSETRAQRALLTVIFARRQDARREEDGPAALAGVVTRVRDGGDRLAAGAGERRGGSRPRRASPTLRQRATLPPPAARLPANLSRLWREPSPVPRSFLVIPRPCPEPGQGRAARRAEGMPRAACAPSNRTTGGMVVGGRWCRCWVQIGGIGVTRHRPGCCTCVLHPSGLTLKRQQSGRSLIPCLQRACRSEHIVADLVLVDLALPVDQASCPWLLWSGMWSATQRSARVASTAVVTAALARSTECHGK